MLTLAQYLPFVPIGLLVALGLVSLVTMFLNAVLAAVPKPWRDAVVKRWPATARLANMLRAGGMHATELLTQLYCLVAQKPLPPDASDQAAKFVQLMASKWPPSDVRRLALEFTAAQIAARVHLQAPASPKSNHGFSRGRPMLLVAVLAIAAAGAFSLHACSATQRQTDQAAIVSTGVVVNGLYETNRIGYTDATDALRIRTDGGAPYAEQSAPLDEAFRKRANAIRALTAVLYATARLNDASGPGLTPAQRAAAAHDVLLELQTVTAILRDGSVLPPIPIPAEVSTMEGTLASIAGAVSGGEQ